MTITRCVGMFCDLSLSLCPEFDIRRVSISLIFPTNLKVGACFRATLMLLFYMLWNVTSTEVAYFFNVSTYFHDLKVSLMLLQPHKFTFWPYHTDRRKFKTLGIKVGQKHTRTAWCYQANFYFILMKGSRLRIYWFYLILTCHRIM